LIAYSDTKKHILFFIELNKQLMKSKYNNSIRQCWYLVLVLPDISPTDQDLGTPTTDTDLSDTDSGNNNDDDDDDSENSADSDDTNRDNEQENDVEDSENNGVV
jgi:hypothetical protein